MRYVAQGLTEAFERKHMMFHLEFTEVCNQRCSYCLEGNFDDNKPKPKASKKEDMIGTVEKIFKAFDESYDLYFVLIGGECTLQPHFMDVVNKIKSRKNTYMLLTTNFSHSIEFYRELDIPLITSVHFEFHEPKPWLEKTLKLQDLIAHTRIMAHPDKLDKVKELYELLKESSKNNQVSCDVGELLNINMDVNGYTVRYNPNYSQEQLEFIRSLKPIICEYPDELSKRLGIFKGALLREEHFYKNKGSLVKGEKGSNNFKGWYCQRSVNRILGDGQIVYSWCEEGRHHRLYSEDKYPKSEVGPIICYRSGCNIDFLNAVVPKYKSIKEAPAYMDKKYLLKLRLKELEPDIKYLLTKRIWELMLLYPLKIVCMFILNKEKQRDFRAKHINPLKYPKTMFR